MQELCISIPIIWITVRKLFFQPQKCAMLFANVRWDYSIYSENTKLLNYAGNIGTSCTLERFTLLLMTNIANQNFIWGKNLPSESTMLTRQYFSKVRNFQGRDLGAEHADWLCSRSIVFPPPFICIIFKYIVIVSCNVVPYRYSTRTASCKDAYGKMPFSPELKSYLITQWNCTTIGSCRCRKTNQWVGSGAARTYGDDTRQYSRRNGRGIWLYKRSFRHRILRFFLLQRRRLRLRWSREAYSPLTRLAVGPSDLDLLGWSAFNAPQHRSSSGPVRCRYPAIT